MFSESLRKKIARFLVYMMLFCNVSPAFAMQGVRSDYRVTARQRNVLNKVNGVMMPALFVEAYKLTEQVVAGVATMVYQAVCSQMIMSALVAHMFDAASKMTSFVDIEGLGRVRVDENNAIVLDAATLSDPTKTVSFTTDRGVVLDAIRCDTIAVTAPSITVRGNTFIKSLDISLSEVNGIFAIDAGSTLFTESVIIDGMIHNYGTLELLGDAVLHSNESVLFNKGTVRGNRFALENIGSVINRGSIFGQSIGLQSNFLQNDGTIGGTESALDLMVHKSVINNNEIFGKSAKVVLTSDDRGFSNKGSIDIANTELQVSGYFKNEGTSELGTLTGFVSTLFNKGRLKSKYGSLSIDTGENQHILKLASLISNGDFLNTFTDQYSAMKIESILGTGKLFNRSAFKMLGVGALGIKEFYNQNAEFIARYGCSSFGNTVRFMNSLGKLVNEGSLLADTLSFDDTDAIVTNAPTAIIKTTHEMKGRVKSFDNLGGLFSEHSFISLMFDTFVHRGKLLADKGVSFTGKTLRNYSDLSLHSSRINRIFNGESIMEDVDDAFFTGMDKAITSTASDVAAMPIAQRREAIADILQKAGTMNLMQEEIRQLQVYFDATAPITLPTYSPTFHMEQVHSWTQVWGAYNGGYSLWNQFATDPKTGVKTFVQQHKLHTNPQAAQVTASITAANNQAIAKNTELEADYKRKSEALEAAPFPMAELSKLISVYNRRFVPMTSANLWMYFGSNVGRLENTGHIEFIKDLHTIDAYMGTAESEFLVPKADVLPDYTDVLTDIAEPQESPSMVQYGEAVDDVLATTVTEKKIEGAGKIQAAKIRITDWGMIDRFSLLTDELETVTPGFINTKDIVLPRTKLVFDLLTQDFENTGSITSLGFLVRNCGIFKNKSRIETHADIDVTAREILNTGEPLLEIRSTPSTQEWVYSSPGTTYQFRNYSQTFMRSGGKTILNGESAVKNEYAYILANSFMDLLSGGLFSCRTGIMYANGVEPSHIKVKSLDIACDAPFYWTEKYTNTAVTPNALYKRGVFEVPYPSSRSSQVHFNGDLFLEVTEPSKVTGSRLTCGGDLHGTTGNISALSANFGRAHAINHRYEPWSQPHHRWGEYAPYGTPPYYYGGNDQFFSQWISGVQALGIQLTYPAIFGARNYMDMQTGSITLRGGLFMAGSGMSIESSGTIAAVGTQQNLIIPTKGFTIDVASMSKNYTALMKDPITLERGALRSLTFNPFENMRPLFLDKLPDLSKKIIIHPSFTILPMILSDMSGILGPIALNPLEMLAGMEQNARALVGDTNVPALISRTQFDQGLVCFTVEEVDKDTQMIKPIINVSTSILDQARKAFTSPTGFWCPFGSIDIVSKGMLLDNATIQAGESIRIKTEGSTGQLTAIASKVIAEQDIIIDAEKGVRTDARFIKERHVDSGKNHYSYIETATVESMLMQAGQNILIKGGASEIRGTLVKAKTFVDETFSLFLGVNKEQLRYFSWAKKESGGILGGSSSMERRGYQEIVQPSILEVEEMFSRSGQSLIFESVIAEGLQRLLVEKPIFHETVATLHSHDEVQTKSSGFSLFGMGGAPSIPKDPLIGAFASLSRAANSKALIAEAIKTAANIYGSADDANKLFNAVTSGISLDTASIIAGTLAKRYLNLGISFGSTTTTTTSHQTQQLPNKISAELIELKCPTAVHLQGHHEAREFIVETESFTTTDIVNTATIESKTESSGGSFNPVSAVVGSFFPGMSVGVGTVFMGAVSGSVSDVAQTQRQIMHTPTTVVADRFMLRAGNAHLTDTQISARLVEAIIRGDMVIESLADWFFSEAKGGSFGIGLGFLSLVNGIQNMADAARVTAGMGGGVVDVKEIERKVNAFASIVGEEQFNLVVGGTLLARSAFYGQMDARQTVTAPRMGATSVNPQEHIDAGHVVYQTVQEEHTRKDGSYSIPIGDAVNVAMSTSQFLDWLSKPSAKDAFKKQVAEKAKAEGKSPKEIREESEAAGALVDKIEKQIADEDKIAKGTEPSAEPKQDAPISQETPLGKSPEVALQQHLDQKMTRGLFESDKPRTFQQQLHEDYIVSKIAELQYSRNQAADARRIGTAMQNFVAECGDAANKFINGLGVVLGCPQSASAMPILAVPVIAEVTGALLTYAANNPAAFQRFAAQLWSLGGFAYDLYQRGNNAILERSKVGESSGTSDVSSGSSDGGTAMPDPDNGDHDQKSWKSKIHGKAQKTGTEGHDWQSAKRTVKQAKDPDVAEVHMDTSLIRVTKGKVHSRMRPDVTTVRKDGRIDMTEVQSKSQSMDFLKDKLERMQRMLPEEMQGEIYLDDSLVKVVKK